MDHKLMVVNNLNMPYNNFVSNKTYRKRGTGISESYPCIISLEILERLSDMCVAA